MAYLEWREPGYWGTCPSSSARFDEYGSWKRWLLTHRRTQQFKSSALLGECPPFLW